MNSNQKFNNFLTLILKPLFRKSISYGMGVFSIIFFTSNYSYSQDDDLNEHNPILYDFKTKRFDKIFPFDQSFSVKVKNIEKDINHIHLEIYEYDFREKEFKLGDIISPESLSNYRILYISESWERSLHSGDSGEIVIPYKLKPNQNYSVRIIGVYRSDLSQTEKNELSFNLKKEKDIVEFINKISLVFLNNRDRIPPNDILDVYQAEFNYYAKAIIKNTSPTYSIDSKDLVLQLTGIGDYLNNFSELSNSFETLAKSQQIYNLADTNKESSLKEIEKINHLLLKIDWGVITSEHSDFINLKNTINSLFNNMGSLMPSTNVLKTQIEEIVDGVLDSRNGMISSIVDDTITENTFKESNISSSYRADFVKNAKLYITLDLGLSYVWRMDRVITYTGANIYFRPMNKSIPLANYKGLDRIAVGSSILVGISLNSVDKEDVRKGIFGNSALVLGGGYRVNSFLKINTGTLVYYSNSNNPLISSDRLRTTFSPFVSLSIDLEVKPLFNGIGDSIYK